ncbi:MAG TPA: ABC transporter permease [Solirubrobacteraceae bacterium]|jgi:ABC-type dipeptide/oligopeptide/nickel transport system permease subunit|nr:ABC transporter permease [Solirubrobacteraceae bacterium]
MRHRLRFARTRRGQFGLVIVAIVLAIALLGPFVSPHGPSQLTGAPGAPPGGGHLLGTDYLGHDVLSRVLWGGRSVISLALSATALGFALGTTIGLIAGYSRGIVDSLLMRSVDVILAFPPLLFFLIIVTSVGYSEGVLICGVAVVQAPGIARIVYSATREVSVAAYVEAAVARGETTAAILRRELLPNTLPTLIANLGLTLTYSVLLTAAVNFLGLGLQPPAANWALMISENRTILSLNPWAVVVPATLIAALTIGVNLVGDAISISLGRSETTVDARVDPAAAIMQGNLIATPQGPET